jgi:ABC-type xylose transport system permease subunit
LVIGGGAAPITSRFSPLTLCSVLLPAPEGASAAVWKPISVADPNAGNGFELAAIAAVVIGGTSLMGGRGSVINSLFGSW